MKFSPILPIAFSSLLTASLAAPLSLRYPSPAEAEKRADTILRAKGQSFDEAIHDTLDFGSGEPLLVRDTEHEKRASETLSDTEPKDTASSSTDSASKSITYSGGGSDQTLAPHGNFDSAINALLDFGSSSEPLLVKKDAAAVQEKRALGLPKSSSKKFGGKPFDAAIHDVMDFGGAADPLLGGSASATPLLVRAEKAVEGAVEKIARAFSA